MKECECSSEQQPEGEPGCVPNQDILSFAFSGKNLLVNQGAEAVKKMISPPEMALKDMVMGVVQGLEATVSENELSARQSEESLRAGVLAERVSIGQRSLAVSFSSDERNGERSAAVVAASLSSNWDQENEENDKENRPVIDSGGVGSSPLNLSKILPFQRANGGGKKNQSIIIENSASKTITNEESCLKNNENPILKAMFPQFQLNQSFTEPTNVSSYSSSADSAIHDDMHTPSNTTNIHNSSIFTVKRKKITEDTDQIWSAFDVRFHPDVIKGETDHLMPKELIFDAVRGLRKPVPTGDPADTRPHERVHNRMAQLIREAQKNRFRIGEHYVSEGNDEYVEQFEPTNSTLFQVNESENQNELINLNFNQNENENENKNEGKFYQWMDRKDQGWVESSLIPRISFMSLKKPEVDTVVSDENLNVENSNNHDDMVEYNVLLEEYLLTNVATEPRKRQKSTKKSTGMSTLKKFFKKIRSKMYTDMKNDNCAKSKIAAGEPPLLNRSKSYGAKQSKKRKIKDISMECRSVGDMDVAEITEMAVDQENVDEEITVRVTYTFGMEFNDCFKTEFEKVQRSQLTLGFIRNSLSTCHGDRLKFYFKNQERRPDGKRNYIEIKKDTDFPPMCGENEYCIRIMFGN